MHGEVGAVDAAIRLAQAQAALAASAGDACGQDWEEEVLLQAARLQLAVHGSLASMTPRTLDLGDVRDETAEMYRRLVTAREAVQALRSGTVQPPQPDPP
ncbi:hypothetical protein, partial [Spongiactinospora gelatinilytica]|uniref:hypothetical protein n=1 Tax=Spongiactinospora gelatinilytica TaxID=2666298 RepID=UPI0013143E43